MTAEDTRGLAADWTQETIRSIDGRGQYRVLLEQMVDEGKTRNDPTLAVALSVDVLGFLLADLTAAEAVTALDPRVAELRTKVEALIEEAGGRCRRPDDYDPESINICETHSEILFDEGCEDQPRQLLAVLAFLSDADTVKTESQ